MLGKKPLKLVVYPIILVLMIGYFLDLASTIYVLNSNSDKCLKDTTKVKVVSISKDDTILLENSAYIKGSSIETYIYVNQGIGTYYIPSQKALVVEQNYVETYLGYALIALTVLLICIGRKIYRKVVS